MKLNKIKIYDVCRTAEYICICLETKGTMYVVDVCCMHTFLIDVSCSWYGSMVRVGLLNLCLLCHVGESWSPIRAKIRAMHHARCFNTSFWESVAKRISARMLFEREKCPNMPGPNCSLNLVHNWTRLGLWQDELHDDGNWSSHSWTSGPLKNRGKFMEMPIPSNSFQFHVKLMKHGRSSSPLTRLSPRHPKCAVAPQCGSFFKYGFRNGSWLAGLPKESGSSCFQPYFQWPIDQNQSE